MILAEKIESTDLDFNQPDEYVEYLRKECERAKLSDNEKCYVSTIVDYKEWSVYIRIHQDEFAGSLF